MIVDAAEFFRAWCNDCSRSVFTGQDVSMVNPASSNAVPSVSQASARLWVNITVITPSSRSTRWHSAKMACILAS